MMESDLSLKEKEHWETDVGCLPAAFLFHGGVCGSGLGRPPHN